MSALGSLRRLSRMGPHELYTRGRQAAMMRTDVLLYRLGLDACPRIEADSGARGRFYSDPQDISRIAALVSRRMPDQAAALVDRAERILHRRFDLLGYESLDFGSDIDWSLDPVNGKRSASAPWPAIPYLDFEAVGDHKIVWELNRHQILVTLARAYRITGDARFAAGLQTLWRDWELKNPYPIGINWASTLEVAFRALSWVWTGFLLEGSAADSAEFQRGLARGLARSGWYIERFLSTYFSPNTHLLGEGLALMTIGLRYPGLPRACAWAETGWHIVVDAANRQVHADGGYFEHSTYYHVYALDLFLHARILAARNGVPIPKCLDQTIRRMLSWLAAISQAGAPPRFGDDDGGRLFDPSRNREEHLPDPLSTGAALFRDPALKAASPFLIEETLWLLGPDAAAAFDAIPDEERGAGGVALADSGIYAIMSRRADPASRACQLFIDCGAQGFGAAGHGHADALSVQLAASGRLWLTDPGTCEYVGGDGLRDRFRGTSMHNTLTVDGLDQAEPSGPFSWSALPRVELRRWAAGDAFTVFEGRHFGYERLAAPVVHRRWIIGCGDGFWLVRDVAEGQGSHRWDIRWRFAPDLHVTARGAAAVASGGGESLTLLGEENEHWSLSVEDGDYSPAYGARVAARAVRWSAEGTCPAEFTTAMGFEPHMEVGRLRRVNGDSSGVAGYEYAARNVRRHFFFAAGDSEWHCGEWASDAAVLCFTTSGESRELALAGGSYVEYGGRRVFDAGAPQELIELRGGPGGWRCSCAIDRATVQEVLP